VCLLFPLAVSEYLFYGGQFLGYTVSMTKPTRSMTVVARLLESWLPWKWRSNVCTPKWLFLPKASFRETLLTTSVHKSRVGGYRPYSPNLARKEYFQMPTKFAIPAFETLMNDHGMNLLPQTNLLDAIVSIV